MRLAFACYSILGLLAGCESRQPTARVQDRPTVPRLLEPVAKSGRRPLDTLDVSRPPEVGTAPTDTVLKIGTRRYQLHLTAQTDSSQQLEASDPAPAVADSAAEAAAPLSKYSDVKYTIALRDSAGQLQFERTFNKPAFYRAMSKELVLESMAIRPQVLGYNAPRGLLLFRQVFAVDGTDWMEDALLALNLKGEVQQLKSNNAYGSGGSDCRMQQSADG